MKDTPVLSGVKSAVEIPAEIGSKIHRFADKKEALVKNLISRQMDEIRAQFGARHQKEHEELVAELNREFESIWEAAREIAGLAPGEKAILDIADGKFLIAPINEEVKQAFRDSGCDCESCQAIINDVKPTIN